MTAPPTPPLISIVTVSFNSEKTIADTLISVGAQSEFSYEHIIVDGGSSDRTVSIISEYKNNRLTWLSEPDGGIYDAMQKGLSRARGEFVGFLNADDYFSNPNALATIADTLRSGNFDGFSGVVEQIDSTGRTRRKIGRRLSRPRDVLWGRFPPHPATYLRTSILKGVGGFDSSYKIAGDFDLYVRFLKASRAPLAHLPTTIVKMRLGGASTSGLSSYKACGEECVRSLRAAGHRTSSAAVNLRFVPKLLELVV